MRSKVPNYLLYVHNSISYKPDEFHNELEYSFFKTAANNISLPTYFDPKNVCETQTGIFFTNLATIIYIFLCPLTVSIIFIVLLLM